MIYYRDPTIKFSGVIGRKHRYICIVLLTQVSALRIGDNLYPYSNSVAPQIVPLDSHIIINALTDMYVTQIYLSSRNFMASKRDIPTTVVLY